MTAIPQPVPQRPGTNPADTVRPEPGSDVFSGSPGTDHARESIEVDLNAERATVGTRLVATERVRISKHIVTETKTVSIEVRREELRVERIPVVESDGPAAEVVAGPRSDDGAPAIVLILREEVPQFRLQVVPVERVQVFVDTLTEVETADVTLHHEKVDVTTEPATSL